MVWFNHDLTDLSIFKIHNESFIGFTVFRFYRIIIFLRNNNETIISLLMNS